MRFKTNQNSYSNGGGGSSALASMLGIQLPTGSGTLRENSSSAFPTGASSIQAPVGALNGNNNSVGAIGASKPDNSMQPIGAPGGIPISGYSGGGGNDMGEQCDSA